MKTLMLMFLLTLGAFAQTDTVTAGDMPLPAPIATFPIKDIGGPNAPARCIGTANAYVQPENQIMTWVETTNLSVKNTSVKDIEKMVVKVAWKDVRGNPADGEWDLVNQGKILTAGNIWRLGQGLHQPGPRFGVSQDEYDSTPVVKPTVDCQVSAVAFTDGTIWPENAVLPLPDPNEQ